MSEASLKDSAIAFFGDYRARGVKKFLNTDGYAYSMSIYEGARKIATAQNSGTGGPTEIHFERTPDCAEVEKRFDDHVASVILSEFESDGSFVEELMNLSEGIKNLNKWSRERKKIYFEAADGTIYSAGMRRGVTADQVNAHLDAIKASIKKDNPDMVRFLLDMNEEELTELAMMDTYRSHLEMIERVDKDYQELLAKKNAKLGLTPAAE